MNFGDRIRQLRQDKGLTQPELADAMGIEQSYLSKLAHAPIACEVRQKSIPGKTRRSRLSAC